MDKIITIIIVSMLTGLCSTAQSVSATWQLTSGTPVSATVTGSILADDMLLSNLVIRDYAGPNGPLGQPSQRVNPGTAAYWSSPSYSASTYYAFTVTATAGQPVTITSISLPMGAQNTGNMRAELQYSTDHFTTDVHSLNPVTIVLPNSSYLPAGTEQYNTYIPLAAGSSLSVRVLPFLSSASTNTSRYIFLQNVVITGTTAAIDPPPASIPQPAFPGAEGAGKYVTGGRGTATIPSTVFEVTSLSDDNVPGTLRFACSATTVYRTIVFRVSGTIHLNANLVIPANTTMAGQTAPGDGICLADHQVSVGGDNVIVRYMRFRLGDRYQDKGLVDGSGDDDAFDGFRRSMIIIDHCTMSWSTDEAFSFYGGDNVTLQWNMVSEPLNYSYHFEAGDANYETHGLGAFWGARNGSFHHNLIAHALGRLPRFSGSNNYTPVVEGTEKCDMVNNVLYDWGAYSGDGGAGGRYNIINNYYKYGPSFNGGNKAGVPRKFEIMSMATSPQFNYGKVYLNGNYMDGNTAITNNNWLGMAMAETTQADTVLAKVTAPFPSLQPLPIETAAAAYAAVLKGAGAILPKRDTLDQRIADDVRNRTGHFIDVQGGYPHGTPYANTVNAWPTLNTAPALSDTDHDGMPDVWETRRGLNPNDAADRNGYTANGYTNLENYLDGDSLIAPGTINTPVTAPNIIANNTGGWIDAKDTFYAQAIPTDTMNVIASIKNDGNYGAFAISYYVTNMVRTSNGMAYLNRNITIMPLSTVNGPVTVRLYFTTAEFDTLKQADATITAPGDLRILHTPGNTYTALTGTPDIITPVATGTWGTYQTGYYIEFQATAFGTFFIAGRNTTLPLTLLSFTAAAATQGVHLQWQASNEINMAMYGVERSTDATRFENIHTVKAFNTPGIHPYACTDPVSFTGPLFYRLRLTNTDGSYRYSKIVTVSNEHSIPLLAFPNPAKDKLVITHAAAQQDAVLQITGAEGRQVFTQAIKAGATTTVTSLARLPAGTYFILFRNGDTIQSTQLIKE